MARGHRPAVSERAASRGPAHAGPLRPGRLRPGWLGAGLRVMADPVGREAVAAVWRIESARIVGALARYTGDFALAEDLAQEALAEALVTWPRDGVPGKPPGGCSPSAAAARSTLSPVGPPSTRSTPPSPATWTRAAPPRGNPPQGPGTEVADLLWDPDRIDDEILGAGVHLLPPGAVQGGEGGAHPPGGRRPDERRDRQGVPRPRPRPCRPRITRDKQIFAAAVVPFGFRPRPSGPTDSARREA